MVAARAVAGSVVGSEAGAVRSRVADFAGDSVVGKCKARSLAVVLPAVAMPQNCR
jgi:hypothetical protein